MVAEIIILIVALLLLILSVFLFKGKGAWLIAGYNTASKEEQAKYDKKKICKATGYICLVSALMLFVMAYMGYKVDSGVMSEDSMFPFGLIFATVIITIV